MAPKNREIVVYYDYGDVIQSSSSVSSLSMKPAAIEERRPHSLSFSLRRKPDSYDEIRDEPEESSYSIRQFDFHHYDNVEHKWEQKPFLVKTLKTFPLCGASNNKINSIIARTTALLKMLDCWDPEALVLTDSSNPFRSKIYFTVQNMRLLPRNSRIEYLSGVWLSKVFVGLDNDLVEWIDTVEGEVQEKYDNKRATQQWLAYYPTKAQHPNPEKYSMVTYFIKVRELVS